MNATFRLKQYFIFCAMFIGAIHVLAQSAGTGGTWIPIHITNVTGGDSIPDTSGAPTANCDSTGKNDCTSCLQKAIDNATTLGKPLLIPASSKYYKITAKLKVTTSIIGIGGKPTLKMVGANGSGSRPMLSVKNRTNAIWISNIHLDGGYIANQATSGEWDHCLTVINSSNITIQDNVFENPFGDCIYFGNDGGSISSNVLVNNNTFKNPRRCGIAFIYADRVVVVNNILDKQVNYVSAIDFEPNQTPDKCTNIEVAHNKFIMNNRSPGKNGSDGRASSAWQNESTPDPGGNLYLHDNCGTFGVGWWMNTISYKSGNGNWYNIKATTGQNNIAGECKDNLTSVIENEKAATISLFPNPTKQNTTLFYTLSENSFVNIYVYNLFGTEVLRVLNEKQIPGEHKLSLNTSTLQNGVYFIKMNVDGKQLIKKLVVNK